MPFFVKTTIDGHAIQAPANTAKEAFAKAIEWQIVRQFPAVTISDGTQDYSIAEFSEALADDKVAASWRRRP